MNQTTNEIQSIDHAKEAATPFFSIIVPVYNVAPYLRECLDSVLAQTFTDWECLCVDDGSTDESGSILDEYAQKDPRFRIFHKKNGGVSSARNLALDNVKGERVLFLDADDYYMSNDMFYNLYENVSKIGKDDILYFNLAQSHKNINGVENTSCFEQDFERDGLIVVARENETFPQKIITIGFYQIVYTLEKIKDIRFTDLPLGEDLLFFHNYLLCIKDIYHLNCYYYAYRNRDDSATHAQINSIRLRSLLMYRKRMLELYKSSIRFPKDWRTQLERWVKWSFPKILYSSRNTFTKEETKSLVKWWLNELNTITPFRFFFQIFGIRFIGMLYVNLIKVMRNERN